MRRLGIFGGTFDPPHVGHLTMARRVAERCALERVLWVPVDVPSHKARARTSYARRLEMVRLAVADDPTFEVSDAEGRIDGPSYTCRLLEWLRENGWADWDFHFVVGADSLEEIHTWMRWRELFTLARFVAVSRPGHALENPHLEPWMRARILLVDSVALDLSSTEIRAAVAEGRDPGAWLTPAVADYLRREGLYRPVTSSR